ncbi:Ig-like domain-containing protein [Alishewanella longhuensis]
MVSIRQLWVVVFLFALSACGGGGTLDNGGGNNNGGGNTPVYTLGLTIKNGQGQNTNQLSLASPLLVEATLSATNNGVTSGRLINFTFDTPGLASFGNDTGSAATNANGIATIGINVGTLSGAGKITASFGDITAEVVFISAGDGDTEVGVQIGSVLLIADKLQLGSADTDEIELSALVRNTSNNVVSGVPVVFSTDSGELQILDTESAANGIARATLTTRSDKNNREIRVVARAQQQVSELLISVVGTQIDIASPQAVVLNDSALIDIFVQDSEGKGIEGVVVNITSALGNTLSMTNPITSGASGKAAVTYTAVNSGVDTLLVTALGSQRSATLNVSPDSFTFLPTIANPPPVEEVELNTPKRLLLQWLVDDLPNATQMVNFATSRGVIAESAAELGMNKVSVVKQTDATGQADVFVQSRFAGLATIAAQAGTGEGTVNAQKTVEFIAVTPAKIEVQAFPAQVGPGEQSTVRLRAV